MRAIRWILVLPVAVTVGLASEALLTPILGFLDPVGTNLVSGYAFVFAGVWVAPSARMRTAIVLVALTLCVILGLALGLAGLVDMRSVAGTLPDGTILYRPLPPTMPVAVSLFFLLAGEVLACVHLYQVQKRTRDRRDL